MAFQSIAYLQPVGPLRPANAAVALIVDEKGRYLVQLRDDKPTIFFPDHWGCFGGALEPGETHEQALIRELEEELAVDIKGREAAVFTRFTFDFGFAGGPVIDRVYYHVAIHSDEVAGFRLGEGQHLQLFEGPFLLKGKVVPYDRFAVWMHCYRDNLTIVSD